MTLLNKFSQLAGGLLILATAALPLSCSTNEMQDTEETDREQPTLTLSLADVNSRATEPGQLSESWASRLEILYFRNGICVDKQEVANALTFPYACQTPVSIKNTPDEPTDIYVVASQETGIAVGDGVGKLKALTAAPSVASATELFYPTESNAVNPRAIVMQGSVTGHNFSEHVHAAISLRRTVAKLRIRLRNPLPAVGTYDETQLKIRLANVPSQTSLLAPDPAVPTTAALLSYPYVEASPADPAYGFHAETSVGSGEVWPHHTYLNPNYQTVYDEAHTTKVEFSLPYKWAYETNYTIYKYEVTIPEAIEPNVLYQLVVSVYGAGTTRTEGGAGQGKPAIAIELSTETW